MTTSGVDQTDPRKPIGWEERVSFADRSPGGPFAYAPDELFADQDVRLRARDLRDQRAPKPGEREIAGDVEWRAVSGTLGLLTNLGPDAPAMAEDLRLEGVVARPNHVFFTHALGGWQANPAYANPAYANPAYANPAYANPAYANPAYANPAYANPAYANPAYANPAYANPADPRRATGRRKSTARPAEPEGEVQNQLTLKFGFGGGGPRVIVLDTGLAAEATSPPSFVTAGLIATADAADPKTEVDVPDSDGNLLLDPAAGHGMFIAGLIKQVCPSASLEVYRVLSGLGDGDEETIAACIEGLIADTAVDGAILNLSFGGYVMDEPLYMAKAVRAFQRAGGLVVASAGNDGTCRPSYPAALPDVISVGAFGPLGPAGFSNWGPWVRACAPGVDLVSAFFKDFDGIGREPGPDGSDPDKFNGWATWSGTSFAAPIVAAAIAQTMVSSVCTADQAADRILDTPGLLTMPGMGTVVNML